MSKEYLEALKIVDNAIKKYSNMSFNLLEANAILSLEQALERLESIDNANPSEALKCLDKMANYILLDEEYGFIDDEEKQSIIKDRDTIKQALLKAEQDKKKLNEIEKSLKALEIIKGKLVDVSLIKKYDFVEDYNSAVWIAGRPKLVKEEFNLLKEVLE